jgi:outer membrane protein OmpA-like peptidoglycan-associated protein
MYRTGVGPNVPDLVAGSTKDVLSHATFRALRTVGEAPLRHLQLRATSFTAEALAADPDATINVEEDLSGMLSREERGTLTLAVNDTVVALPVVHASASLRGTGDQGGAVEQRFTVLEDSLVPLVLDVRRPATGAGIRYLRITWPQPSTIERQLAEERTSTVYGIWFDYNSAAIRAESEVVLRSIAQVMRDHPDWVLRIEGHTDAIGGAAYNQTLSERRADAVRTALVERHGISGDRLTTGGSGASRPLETNDTPEGRTRNRRVELIRR